MDSRRITALASLGLVGAGVVGLVVTSGGDDDPAPVAAPAVADAAPEQTTAPTTSAAPVATDAVEPDDTAAETTAAPSTEAPTTTVDPALLNPLVPDLPDRGPHLPLIELDGWLQSDIESLDELRGKVVAVQFWTFGCHNCNATKPHMRALYEKYGGEDFEIVGVHAPEFDFERDPVRIQEAADELGVTWPIALDTEKKSFRSWQTERRFWPRIYLIDQEGNVRYDKIGEGKYDVIDAAVGALIAEGKA